MIQHDPKSWHTHLYRFHRSDTFRRLLPWILAVCVYAAVVAWLEISYWKLSANSAVRNISMMHTLLGVVLSFVLVFRTNTAYDRWWEGRKLWGTLVNSSRNLAIKLSAMLPAGDPERAFFRKMIPVYAFTLRNHLRSESTRLELFDDLPEWARKSIDLEKHMPNQVASLLYVHTLNLVKAGKLDGFQFLSLNQELQSFTEICGACERIRNTPIPYSYSVFIKKFIMVYVATLPFGFVFSLEYFVVPIVGFIFYVLTSLELIAEEIEEPFGGDENDLPLTRLSKSIEGHMQELI